MKILIIILFAVSVMCSCMTKSHGHNEEVLNETEEVLNEKETHKEIKPQQVEASDKSAPTNTIDIGQQSVNIKLTLNAHEFDGHVTAREKVSLILPNSNLEIASIGHRRSNLKEMSYSSALKPLLCIIH